VAGVRFPGGSPEEKEYEAIYYPETESNSFPMSIRPRTTATGEMAFLIPAGLGVVTLEVMQNAVGERGIKVIYTLEIYN
jgi:hypothetical protein